MPRRGPLRKVVGYQNETKWTGEKAIALMYEILECGHHQRPVRDLYGETQAARRRCQQCLAERNIQPTKFHTELTPEQIRADYLEACRAFFGEAYRLQARVEIEGNRFCVWDVRRDYSNNGYKAGCLSHFFSMREIVGVTQDL